MIFFLFKYIRDERDGFVLGIAMGVGFAVIENVFYVVKVPEIWGFLTMIRSYNMVLHVIGPAMIGYFIGMARRKKQRSLYALIPVGWLIGVVVHATWNGVLSTVSYSSFTGLTGSIAIFVVVAFVFIFPLLEWAFVLFMGWWGNRCVTMDKSKLEQHVYIGDRLGGMKKW